MSDVLRIVIDDLSDRQVITWEDKQLRGCGALHELDATHAELKSMRTVTQALRTGVSSKILAHLIDESRRRGYQRLSLETGSQPGFLAARKFYEHHGFTVTEPFANYAQDPKSVYYTIRLGRFSSMVCKTGLENKLYLG